MDKVKECYEMVRRVNGDQAVVVIVGGKCEMRTIGEEEARGKVFEITGG